MKELCPYCGAIAKLVDSSVIYGKSYGMAYICSNYPDCDAYVGAHKGTDKPKGRLANPELRELRKQAHAAFDPLWRSGSFSRTKAYRWLSRQLKIPFDETHIGNFDEEMCLKVISVIKRYNEKQAI